jgi:hypothetical protein
MWKHVQRFVMVFAAIGASLGGSAMWVAGNSIPKFIKDADGNFGTNLKWIGLENPPPELASAAADHWIYVGGAILLALSVVSVLGVFIWNRIAIAQKIGPLPSAPIDASLAPSSDLYLTASSPPQPTDNTFVGSVHEGLAKGHGNTVVNFTDDQGNTILNTGGVALGRNACADSTSIAIGSGARAGNAKAEKHNPQ